MRILFVCLGNICRSPGAEGVFARLLADTGAEADIEIDSAGTHAYHVGEPPDTRMQEAARARGVEIGHLRARCIVDADFERFDLVLAMDQSNLEVLQARAPQRAREKIRLLMDYAGRGSGLDVPDPYYGGAAGFERVLDLAEEAARGLLAALQSRRTARP